MGQWGLKYQIGDTVYLPHVITVPFFKINKKNIIDEILVTSYGINYKENCLIIKELRNLFLKKPYKYWIEMSKRLCFENEYINNRLKTIGYMDEKKIYSFKTPGAIANPDEALGIFFNVAFNM